MRIESVISAAINEGVVLFLKNDRLAFKAQNGLSGELKAHLKQHKSEIVAYLQTHQSQGHEQGLGKGQSGLNIQLPPLTKRATKDVGEPMALSFSQQRLWFIDQLEGGSSQYNLPAALMLQGAFDIKAFKQSLNVLVSRHEILRTVYHKAADANHISQQVKPQNTDVAVELIDLSGATEQVQQQTLAELNGREATLSFDLSHDLMLRSTVVTLAPQQHVVLFTLHHIASDGWSMGLLIKEFTATYQGLVDGQSAKLAPLEVQYGDFATWQHSWLQGEVLEQGLDYWKNQLDGIAPVHSLPLDRPRPAQQSYQGANHTQVIDGTLLSALDKLSQQHQVTQFMLLQTAFALLVSRYSRQSDVVMGTPIAGRLHPSLEGLIGFFINNLVLRTDCRVDATFSELLAANKKTILGAFEHQYLPFDVLVEALNPQRSLSHDAIFQIVFGLNNTAGTALSLPGLTISELPAAKTAAKVELELAVTPKDGSLSVDWTYNTAIFDGHSIAAMADCFLVLLNAIVEQPNALCSTLTLMNPAAEQHMLQIGRNESVNASVKAQNHQTLVSQFASQVQANPDATAIVSAQGHLSYQQFDQISSRLAAYLQEMDIGCGSRVGIYLGRGAAQLISVMAVNKAGGAYVPLDPGLPEARLKHMVTDSKVELVLLPSELMNTLALSGVDVFLMDDVLSADWLAEFDGSFEAHEVQPHDEAYVLYTSGSTGLPKGVKIAHQNLSHYLAHAQSQYLPEHIQGSVVSSPLCFDATLTTLLTPLCVGKSVHLLADGDAALAELPNYLFDQNNHWLFKLTPAHLDALVYSGDQQQTGTGRHTIVVGGEQLTVATLSQYKNGLLPNSCFVNEYGPTETVVGTSVMSINSKAQMTAIETQLNVPIGKAIADSHLYVVGHNDQLQPQNSIGELYIGGPGVGVGYVNLDQQTDVSFTEFAGQRVYKTGDLVRWLPSGELAFIGRADHQVKINGYRIELGEISAQLLKLDYVQEAVVTARTDNGQDPQLVAYVVCSSFDKQQLRQHLAAHLPQYMVPADFVALEEMPLTTNGKVDTRVLPSPDNKAADTVTYVAPRNAVEALLCKIWAQVMDCEQVGIDDNFFSIGGDSILSIRVVSLLKRQQIVINIKDIFTHQTVAQLAVYITSLDGKSSGAAVELKPFALLSEKEKASLADKAHASVDAAVQEAKVQDAYPLSTLQAGMVFHTQMENFNGVYHDVNAEHVQCPWNEKHFGTALRACIETHPMLRTRFDLAGERPLQLVFADIELPLVVEDIRGQLPQAQQAYLQVWTEARKTHIFDWVNGPLYQINVFLRDHDSFEFVISFHHSVLDGWSRATLVTELYQHYEKLLAGQPIEVDSPEWIYREYVALELEAIEKGEAQNHFAVMLEQAPTQQLPLLHNEKLHNDKLENNPTASMAQGHHQVSGFEQRSKAILSLAKSQGVPLQSILLTVHFKVLATLCGQPQVMSCVVQNGRPELEGGENGLGLFLNSVPLALTLTDGSWQDLIQQVTSLNIETLSHRHYPLANIQKDTDMAFSEVLFNYTHFHVLDQITSNNDLLQVLDSAGFEQTNYQFQVDVARGIFGDALSLSFKYDSNLYGETLIEKVAGYYLTAMDNLLTDVDANHYSAAVMSAQDCQFVLEGIHNTPTVLPPIGNLVDLFGGAVERNAAAVAVNYEDQSLTYGELNAKANQLTDYLIEQGVKANTLVGLSVPRSLDMVIGILAILKAGGAYVPLDPAYPQDRLTYMMQNSGLTLVLSHSSSDSIVLADDIKRIDMDVIDLARHATTNPNITISTNQLAYIIYTSGSTGQPKGVMVEHGNVQRLFSACEADFNYDENDVWCLFHSYAFDFSVWEMWGALAYGGRLVVVPQWISRSPEDFYRLVEKEQVTVLNQTPTAFTQFNRVDSQQNAVLALRAVVFGGEALNLSELQGWVARHGDESVALVNMYGITETTVHVTYRRLFAQDIANNHGSLIGRAISDLKVYVLDAQLQPVPVGTSGEMYVGGRGVSRGYLHQAELTDSRFINDPRADLNDGEQRLYKTGDLARYLPSGELEYQGRIDEQVKIRGFRIELGEIEQQLSEQPLIDSSVVIVREDDSQVKQLVAYIKGIENSGFDDADLIAQVRNKLQKIMPLHMVPAVFVVVIDWPLTANGKVNKKALPEPDMSVLQARYVAPRTQNEKMLCQIWQSALNLAQVGIEDNYFNIGGDSILSIGIVSALKQWGFELSVKQLFEYQNIAALAPQLEALNRVSTDAVEPFSQLKEQECSQFGEQIEDAYPLSNLQAGMVFHTQLSGFSGIYHDIMAEHIKCPWNEAYFASALSACIAAHPILRSGFILSGERPLQQVFIHIDTPLVVEDIRNQCPQTQTAYLAAWTQARKEYVFDWINGPLFQINIFRRTDASFEFVISFHHAILDGWSRASLSTELYGHYQKLLAGEAVEVPEPEWIYRDFIALEQASINDQSVAEHFNAMLENAPVQQVPHKITADTQALRIQQSCHVEDFAALSGGLLSLAKTQGVPVQSVLLAVHFKVLALLSGQSQAVSCVTHNGRPEQPGADRGLGLYLNSLPLSLELGEGSWLSLIAKVAKLSTDNINYRRYPLAEIQKQLDREFGEVTFNYTHFHIYSDLAHGANEALELLEYNSFEQTNFDFHVDISKTINQHNMTMVVHYNANLFDAEQIETIAQYYVQAFDLLLQSPEKLHHQQSLLSEQAQLQLSSWSAPRADSQLAQTQQPTLVEQFAQQVKRAPHALALHSSEGQLSYQQFDAISDRLAAYLVEMDIAQGSRVGIYLPRSAAQLIAVMGINKAGASYVPLEPGLPAGRLAHMVTDADIELMVLTGELVDSLSLSGVDILLMDEVMSADWLAEFDGGFDIAPLKAQDEAYVLYTSGSTGLPKGVQISHESLSHYLAHAKNNYMPSNIRGSVVSSPLCFDATLTTLLTPLCVGKSVHLLADGDAALSELPSYLFDQNNDWLFKLTPAHLDALVYSGLEAQTGNAQHIIVVGGEQLRVATLAQYKGQLLPNACFVNEYGPTETVVGTSVFNVDNQQALDSLQGQINVPVGKPIAGSQLFVVGINGLQQPVNSIGELYIAGPALAQGYVNLEQQSAERFVQYNGQRVYKTGDLARWLPDGNLEFIGRADHQVKMRGYRIELGEISEQLVKLPQIQEAVAIARTDEGKGPHLVAYVVAPTLCDVSELCKKQLQNNLPEYMVPSAYVALDHMPLTANGKVNVAALPAPGSNDSTEVSYVAPRSVVELQLCQVWAEVMGEERVGIHDNFFSIGGDSILSIRVVSLLQRDNVTINIKDIFNHQTVDELAQYIESEGRSGGKSEGKQRAATQAFALLNDAEVSGLNEQIEDAYPLSALQAGMVFHTQLEGFSGVYHDVNAEHVKCHWNETHFATALSACISTHPILRTRYDLSGERPLQLVYREVDLPLVVDNISHLSESQQQIHVDNWIHMRKQHVFDWANASLLQINVFLRSENSFEFVISFHHSVLDGWSRASLTTELYHHYEQLLAGNSIEAAPAERIYREFVALELEAIEQQAGEQHFGQMLADANTSQLPRLHHNTEHNGSNGDNDNSGHSTQGSLTIEGFDQRSTALITLAKQLGMPVQVVLLAAHLKTLSVFSGQNSATTCIVSHGRPEVEGGEAGVGLFLNSVPLSMALEDNSWGDLIGQINALNLANVAHRHYPLALVQQKLGLALSEVMFNYTHFHVYDQLNEAQDSGDMEVLASTGFEQTNFDFYVDVSRASDQMSMSVKYDAGVYDAELVGRFGQYYLGAVDALLADLHQGHQQAQLMPQLECEQLASWQHVKALPLLTGAMFQAFVEQVKTQPQAIACEDAQGSLTYQQLDSQSNQLAQYLVEQGVGANVIVGLSIEPANLMLVALLAISKAGGAYLPLDPGYPQSRLNYMVQDSGVSLVLRNTTVEANYPNVNAVDIQTLSLAQYSNKTPVCDFEPRQMAYMIYTSGSTGQPKGVMISHQAAANFIMALSDALPLTNTDPQKHQQAKWLLLTSLAFDISLFEWLGALSLGKTVVVAGHTAQQDPFELNTLIGQSDLELVQTTPSRWRQLMATNIQLPQGMTVLCGGEALDSNLAQQLLDQNIQLFNCYGPTEATVWSLLKRVTGSDLKYPVVGLGEGLANYRHYVLSQNGQLSPVGSIGELYIGGDSLAEGYFGQTQLTDERFVCDPYSPVEGAKMYKSGDLVRYLPDGELTFHGRSDNQVKLRGHRIELGEIEHLIGAQHEVNESAVVVVGEGENARLVAYFSLNLGVADADDYQRLLSESLLEQLPAYMVPTAFVHLDQLPQTPNGKVDKNALPEVSIEQSQADYQGATNELEAQLVSLWAELLKLDDAHISIDANFFELGGNSLSLVRLLENIKQQFNLNIDFAQLFDNRTVRSLAALIEITRRTQNLAIDDEDQLNDNEIEAII